MICYISAALILLQDKHVCPAADQVNLTAALASATLSRKPEERIINPNLRRHEEPPWAGHANEDWLKTPMSPPKDFRGRPLIKPQVSHLAWKYLQTTCT